MNKREIEISSSDDVIDVRDVIERVEHLEPIREPGPVDLGSEDNENSQDDLFAELSGLEKLLDELKGYGGDEQWRGDWYPITLIRDSYFKDYAQQFAEDNGAIENNGRWPNYCIDWDRAAHDLQADYSSVEFDGVTYWYR
jgi:hypothetical protein